MIDAPLPRDRARAGRWHARVEANPWHVHPQKGGAGVVVGWSMDMGPWWLRILRLLSWSWGRIEWPRTPEALRRSVALCLEWCARRNEEETAQEAVAASVRREAEAGR